MNCIVWNVRGFNDPVRQKEVVSRLLSFDVNLVGML